MNPDVSDRIAKVKGILEGILRMIESDRPNADVTQQIRAAYGALRRAELEFIRVDIQECIAARGKGVDEVIDRIYKLLR